jgi:hypothetical protein
MVSGTLRVCTLKMSPLLTVTYRFAYFDAEFISTVLFTVAIDWNWEMIPLLSGPMAC